MAGGAARVDRERLAEVATMGSVGEAGRRNAEAEMLQRIEARLGVALHVVGGRWNAINDGDPCASEEAAYCDGFCDALRYVFGTDGEADLIMEELLGAWDGAVLEPERGPLGEPRPVEESRPDRGRGLAEDQGPEVDRGPVDQPLGTIYRLAEAVVGAIPDADADVDVDADVDGDADADAAGDAEIASVELAG